MSAGIILIPFVLCDFIPSKLLGYFNYENGGWVSFTGSVDFNASSVLTFWGSIISAMATVTLSIIAMNHSKALAERDFQLEVNTRNKEKAKEKYIDFRNFIEVSSSLINPIEIMSYQNKLSAYEINAIILTKDTSYQNEVYKISWYEKTTAIENYQKIVSEIRNANIYLICKLNLIYEQKDMSKTYDNSKEVELALKQYWQYRQKDFQDARTELLSELKENLYKEKPHD